ncbi:MAG: hypothetical protein GWN00_15090, partial [Aliifodinibius sp.]|nr:hypothetical protein [Fodinibius sp.]NIV12416.1 hypothetical protein [Fodinibius sp.]NIY26079.1 hypothetical protein [Fodinibius sp.]
EFAPISRLEKKRLLHFKTGEVSKLKKITGAATLKKYIDQLKANRYSYFLTIPSLKELQTQIKDGAVVYTTKDGKAGYVLHKGDIQKV